MLACRLYIDPPADGAWNMAVDESLLKRAADHGEAALRFYQWRGPTLSLGYFQAYAEREAHAASRQAAVVRRSSGGGALVHDCELTYALCLPPDHTLASQSAALYAAVHGALIHALASLGVRARLQADAAPPEEIPATHFLCFARRTSQDVVLSVPPGSAAAVGPAKIAGSAQRRSRGAVLQHGGVLLGQSPCAPELPGIRELTGLELPPARLAAPWSVRLAERLNLDLSAVGSTVDDGLDPAAGVVDKYARPTWTKRR